MSTRRGAVKTVGKTVGKGNTIMARKFTSADLELMPNNGNLYEIIEGELYVSRQPNYEHHYTCNRIGRFLDEWNGIKNLGVVLTAPGLIFADDDDVAPDVVWITRDRLKEAADKAGHLRSAPELVIEVLSPWQAQRVSRPRGQAQSLFAAWCAGILDYGLDQLSG